MGGLDLESHWIAVGIDRQTRLGEHVAKSEKRRCQVTNRHPTLDQGWAVVRDGEGCLSHSPYLSIRRSDARFKSLSMSWRFGTGISTGLCGRPASSLPLG